VEQFVGREVDRYNNYVESSATDPKQARALLAGSQPASPAADPFAGYSVTQLKNALAKAGKAGNQAAVANLRKAIAAKGQ